FLASPFSRAPFLRTCSRSRPASPSFYTPSLHDALPIHLMEPPPLIARQPGAPGSVVPVLVPEHALGRALDGVASVLELVLGVGPALLGLPLGLSLLVVGDLAEALLGLAAQLVLRVLELLVSTHRQPP